MGNGNSTQKVELFPYSEGHKNPGWVTAVFEKGGRLSMDYDRLRDSYEGLPKEMPDLSGVTADKPLEYEVRHKEFKRW